MGFRLGDCLPGDVAVIEIMLSEDGDRLSDFALVRNDLDPTSPTEVTLSGRVGEKEGGGEGPVAVCTNTVLLLDETGQALLNPAAVDGGSFNPGGRNDWIGIVSPAPTWRRIW